MIVKPGARLSRLVGSGLDGQRTEIDVGKGNSLVFTFSIDCPFCRSELDYLRATASTAIRNGCSVSWIVKEPPTAVVANGLLKDVVGTLIAEPTYWTHRATGLTTVPQTAALSDGLVLFSWTGVPDANSRAKLDDFVLKNCTR